MMDTVVMRFFVADFQFFWRISREMKNIGRAKTIMATMKAMTAGVIMGEGNEVGYILRGQFRCFVARDWSMGVGY